MAIKFNVRAAQYALKNGLHVEYFIWCYLRMLGTSGMYDKTMLRDIKPSTVNRKLKPNLFFNCQKGKIFLKSKAKLHRFFGKIEYEVDYNEIATFANKLANHSHNIIKGWNDTLIKYLLVSVCASKHQTKQPYALELISHDLNYSVSTIQRAVKTFGVFKENVKQEAPSLRGYRTINGDVYLSPNYYTMPVGEFRQTKF